MNMSSDAELLQMAIAAPDGSAQPEGRRNLDVLYDHTLPALVRGYIAMNQGPATEVMAIREAGLMPRLYGTYKEKRVRVVMVSRLGDIGISYKDQEYGYSERVSVYDLTDFGDEMHPTAPARRPSLTFYTIVDRKGRWIDESDPEGGSKMLSTIVSEPRLFVEQSTASAMRSQIDRLGSLGYDVIPVKLTKAPE